jgi:hypothetical protein
VFQLADDLRGAVEVVVRGGLRAVFAGERHGDVHVVVAVLGQPVTNGHPPARGLAAEAP